MGMYCACGVKKYGDHWKCECDWDGWFLCYKKKHIAKNMPDNIPIKTYPEKNGIYQVRVFEDGDDAEYESEYSVIEKNWGEPTNQAISRWKIEYNDNWTGYRGVYAWKPTE